MWSFAYVLTRIKDYWQLLVGLLVASIPVVTYLFGRKDGAVSEKEKFIKDTVRREVERADFYKGMGEATHEAQANRPNNRDELIERLRKHGL
jgi:hypothetical protein